MFGVLGLAQCRVAQLFGVGPRSVRRWQHGDRRVPRGVGIVLRLLATGAVTIAEVEEAAVSAPARTNGRAELEPPVPLLVEPAPEQTAALANPDLTTAEKVCALAPEACRWPDGDPKRPDFHFCGNPVAERPYCERHRAMAYMVR
jgi:GcrA cell cycle regulator